MRRAAVIAMLLCGAMCMSAQRTTRRTLTPAPKPVAATAPAPVCQQDTLRGDAATAMVSLTGYEKPLRATRETLRVANNSDTLTVETVCFEIEYRDMHGLMLHRREVELPLWLAAGEARMASFKSWDVNKVFYYHVNEPPRTSAQGTPYTVAVRLLWLTLPEYNME